MVVATQLLINGILLGAFYATMALGFSTIWGVMRLINLAHGEFLLVAAYVAWFFFNPTREQGLQIGSVHISMMAMVMLGLFYSIGFMTSHVILGLFLGKPPTIQRRLFGYGIGIIITGLFYAFWAASAFIALDPFLVLPLIFVLFFGIGYLLQKYFFNRLVGKPNLTMLLITFSVAIILQTILLAIYAADPRRVNVAYNGAFVLFQDSLTVSPVKFLIMLVSMAMILGLAFFLRYTRIGYAIRAAAQNTLAAKLMGINIYEVYAITFAICLGLTGMAGAMMGTFQPITPVTGPIWTLRAFSIVALGGLGKVEGVVVGGLALGLVESFIGGYVGIGWAIAAAFSLLVFMLIVRPQGITGGLVPAET